MGPKCVLQLESLPRRLLMTHKSSAKMRLCSQGRHLNTNWKLVGAKLSQGPQLMPGISQARASIGAYCWSVCVFMRIYSYAEHFTGQEMVSTTLLL
jgi:hypothetical protein